MKEMSVTSILRKGNVCDLDLDEGTVCDLNLDEGMSATKKLDLDEKICLRPKDLDLD